MKLIKKLLILFLKKIKIILPIILTLSLSYSIYYLNILDLTFFNNQEIHDFKKELLEFKDDLNLETKKDLNLETKKDLNIDQQQDLKKTLDNNNLYKYLIVASCIVLFVLIIYFNNGDNELSSDDITFHEIAEIKGLNTIDTEADRKLAMSVNNYPKESFVDEVDDLRAQLEKLAKK